MNPALVSDLVARARVVSGLRSNQLYTDVQVVDQLNSALASLHDVFVAKHQHHFAKPFKFTAPGGAGMIALPPDFQADATMDCTSAGVPISVRRLPSWLERSRYQAPDGSGFARRYFPQGGNLFLFPPNATGTYTLWYTPMAPTLSLTDSTRTVPVVNGVTTMIDVGVGHAVLTTSPGSFDPARDNGASLVVNFNSPAQGYNGTYTIELVATDSIAVLDQPLPGNFPQPTGGTITETYGGLTELPAPYAPWSEYLVVYAAFLIRRSRQEELGGFEKQIDALTARIERALDRRTEEPGQAALRSPSASAFLGWDDAP